MERSFFSDDLAETFQLVHAKQVNAYLTSITTYLHRHHIVQLVKLKCYQLVTKNIFGNHHVLFVSMYVLKYFNIYRDEE